MPPVNNITGTPAKPATPAPKPPIKPNNPPAVKPPTNPPAAPKPVTSVPASTHPLANLDSVKAESDAVKEQANTELAQQLANAIPSWLQQSNLPEIVPQDESGYVGFAHPMSKRWGQQQAVGLDIGDIYLYREKQYIPMKNGMRFFLLTGESFQSFMNSKGEFLWVSRDLELQGPTQGNNKTESHYICLLLVDIGEQLVPIKGDFRGTKGRGIEAAIRAVEAAATPEWIGMSDAHRLSVVFPQPFGRVTHYMTTSQYIGKSTGNESYITNVSSSPATYDQMKLLADEFQDENFQNELAEAKANFEARIKFMDGVATKPRI